MTTTVYLIRHGAHAHLDHTLSGRQPGLSLTERGRAQALALGEAFAEAGLTALHSSPVQRARETADAIGAACGLPVAVVPALDEIDFGAWTGRSFAELEGDPSWREWNRHRDTARAPGGETMAQAVDRAWAHLRTLADGARVALVTHCDVVRGVVARAIGLSFDRIHRFAVDAASVSRLTLAGGAGTLESLNGTRP